LYLIWDLGEAAQDSKVIQSAKDDLAVISGQLPITTTAKKSIATYKQELECL
jgi:large subunit ribosomal protein L5